MCETLFIIRFLVLNFFGAAKLISPRYIRYKAETILKCFKMDVRISNNEFKCVYLRHILPIKPWGLK